MSLDAATRKTLLEEFFRNADVLDELKMERSLPHEKQAEEVRLMHRQGELLRAYREGLPKTPLARCPFSGEIYAPPFDPFGLDGLWWNYYRSQRPLVEPPGHWIALTGAMKLAEPVEKAPFPAMPGPGAPFVLRRLVEHPVVKAVLCALPVGRHTAYAVTYFGSAWPEGVAIPNLWGADHYLAFLSNGDVGRTETFEDPGDRDFELARWIEAGKLAWIAPGDSSMTLRTGVDGCPYLSVTGTREDQHVAHGFVDVGEPA